MIGLSGKVYVHASVRPKNEDKSVASWVHGWSFHILGVRLGHHIWFVTEFTLSQLNLAPALTISPRFTRGKRQAGNKMLILRFYSKMFPINILTPSMGRSYFMCHHYGSDQTILCASSVLIMMTILIRVNWVNWPFIQDHMSADKDLIVMPYQVTHTLVLNQDRNQRKAITILFTYESSISSSRIFM